MFRNNFNTLLQVEYSTKIYGFPVLLWLDIAGQRYFSVGVPEDHPLAGVDKPLYNDEDTGFDWVEAMWLQLQEDATMYWFFNFVIDGEIYPLPDVASALILFDSMISKESREGILDLYEQLTIKVSEKTGMSDVSDFIITQERVLNLAYGVASDFFNYYEGDLDCIMILRELAPICTKNIIKTE